MIYYTDIEHSKNGILMILDLVKNFEKEGEIRFIEGIKRRGFTEYMIQQLICIVRERMNMTRRELFRLSEIALTFNKQWATDDNNCFHDANKMFWNIRSTLKGTKIIFKKFTPICRKPAPYQGYRPSVFINSTLAHGGCGLDMYGLSVYPDSVATLYAEMGAYFANVVAVLVLCHQELKRESEISKDADLCLQLLNEQCKTIVDDMKDVMGLMSKEQASKDELLVKSKNTGSLKKFAQEGFHKYNITSMKRFAASRAVENGALLGLGEIESIYFADNPEKGKQAHEIMSNFDLYADKGRGDKMDSTSIIEFICMSGLPLKKGYSYMSESYHGKYILPQWKSVLARFSQFKHAEPEAFEDGSLQQRLASDFEKRLDKRND